MNNQIRRIILNLHKSRYYTPIDHEKEKNGRLSIVETMAIDVQSTYFLNLFLKVRKDRIFCANQMRREAAAHKKEMENQLIKTCSNLKMDILSQFSVVDGDTLVFEVMWR